MKYIIADGMPPEQLLPSEAYEISISPKPSAESIIPPIPTDKGFLLLVFGVMILAILGAVIIINKARKQ